VLVARFEGMVLAASLWRHFCRDNSNVKDEDASSTVTMRSERFFVAGNCSSGERSRPAAFNVITWRGTPTSVCTPKFH
jgi:hypothetical protein